MIKNYVIDTNVMIHDPNFMNKFQDNNIIIPIVCLEELDNLKSREGIVGYNARNVAKALQMLMKNGDLSKGILLEEGGTLRVELNQMKTSWLPDGLDQYKNDTRIISVVRNLQLLDVNMQTILVTKDVYMSIKASALGVEVQDYQNDKISTDEVYKGYMEIFLPSKEIDKVYDGGLELPGKLKGLVYPNEFFHIKSTDKEGHEIIAKYRGKKLRPLQYGNDMAWGLTPLNREQKMAFEALMDPEMNFVSITGGAGSGKTILATAVAMKSVLENNRYKKIIFVRPVVSAGNEIGYLPGSEKEKLKPWMGSFYDSIETLIDMKDNKNTKPSGNKSNATVDDFIEQYIKKGIIETKTFTYMRGRTFNNALIIVDEAQEMTPHLAKLMLTRAGTDSKFIFLGDPSDNQIDNQYVDSKSNGLIYTVEKMKPFDLTAHITLSQVERSPLAEIAEKNM